MLAITEANVSRLDAAPRQSGRTQPERRHSMKILVVDDHFLIREALRTVLMQLKRNATVLEAVDGRQTMQLASEHTDIGLVLLDLNLPDRDGFSVLGDLRERHPAMSVVVLSPCRTETASRGRSTSARSASFQSRGSVRSC